MPLWLRLTLRDFIEAGIPLAVFQYVILPHNIDDATRIAIVLAPAVASAVWAAFRHNFAEFKAWVDGVLDVPPAE